VNEEINNKSNENELNNEENEFLKKVREHQNLEEIPNLPEKINLIKNYIETNELELENFLEPTYETIQKIELININLLLDLLKENEININDSEKEEILSKCKNSSMDNDNLIDKKLFLDLINK
jgi:hypothetical protein